MNMNEPVASHEAEMEWAFPTVDPGNLPLGGRILVQLRRTKKKTTSAGIILVEETRETEKWNAQVAKVIKLGPLAFRNRETMEPWPEGVWVKEGDFIRAPRWGGDRWGGDRWGGDSGIGDLEVGYPGICGRWLCSVFQATGSASMSQRRAWLEPPA